MIHLGTAALVAIGMAGGPLGTLACGIQGLDAPKAELHGAFRSPSQVPEFVFDGTDVPLRI